jgi:hypothetical protein
MMIGNDRVECDNLVGGQQMRDSTFVIDTFVPALRTLSGVLDKGAEHVRAKGLDPEAMLKERIASDMFPLSSQIALACHHAKDGAARAAGLEPPKIDIEELNFDEYKTLIAKTIETLTAMNANAFDGAVEHQVEMSLSGGRVFQSNGLEFVQHWSIPHFYFHVVTAYDILRHIGVPLGKRDYMTGIVGAHVRQSAPPA